MEMIKYFVCISFSVGVFVVLILLLYILLLYTPGCDILHIYTDVEWFADNTNKLYKLRINAEVLSPSSFGRHPELVVPEVENNCNTSTNIQYKNVNHRYAGLYADDRVIGCIQRGSFFKVVRCERIWAWSWWYGITNHIVVLGLIYDDDGNTIDITNSLYDVTAFFHITKNKVRPIYKLIKLFEVKNLNNYKQFDVGK